MNEFTSRREFLRAATLTGAGLALSNGLMGASNKSVLVFTKSSGWEHDVVKRNGVCRRTRCERYFSHATGPQRPLQSVYRAWRSGRPLLADAGRRIHRARTGTTAAGCGSRRERSQIPGSRRCNVACKFQRRMVFVEGLHARSARNPHAGHAWHEWRVLPARAVPGHVGAATWERPRFLHGDGRPAGELEE